MKTISVVIPVRNERESVQPLFDKLSHCLPALGRPYRVIVVDGFSTDGTVESIRRYVDGMPIEIIELRENLGLGGALEAGLKRALEDSEIVVTMDGDDSHDPAVIETLVNRLEQDFDVVVASRFEDGGRQIGVRWHRRLMSRGAGLVLRFLYPIGTVKDYSSGFRAYRAATLRHLNETRERLITEEGFSCQMELMLALREIGARGTEVPLVLRYDLKRSPSKMDVSQTAVRYLVLILNHLGRARIVNWRRSAGGVAPADSLRS